MAVASWMLRTRSLRTAKAFRSKNENKEDTVKLDFNLDPCRLMKEILSNICQKHDITSVKKLSYLNAFVHLMNKNPKWKSPDTFGLSTAEILQSLRIALIQDSVQVRAAGLRAIRCVARTEEDILYLNKLQFPYLIARSLDLLLKTDNERVLMSERIQSLKMMRHILSIAPQHFSEVLVRPLVSVVLRPIEETEESDRLLKTCLAILCELCVLNSTVFIKCDGVRALLRNANRIPSSHMTEAICGALLFLLNKPSTRESAKIDLRYLVSSYTNSAVTEKNREEERRLMWTNFVMLTLLRSCSGIFHLCSESCSLSGLKSIVQILYLNQHNIRKSILGLLFDLLNLPQPEWTDSETAALESVEKSRFQESFKLNEGFLVVEGKYILPNISKNRVNLAEVHTSLLLICLLESGLPDALVEVIVSSDSILSLQASILLGEFLHLIRQFLPSECFVVPPSMPNLISYATRGCPLQLPVRITSREPSESLAGSYEQYSSSFSHYSKDLNYSYDNSKIRYPGDNFKVPNLRLSSTVNVPDNVTTKFSPNETVMVKSTEACNPDLAEENASASGELQIPPLNFKLTSPDVIFEKDIRTTNESVLNINRADFPPCKHKQKMALSAISTLSNLQKRLEKPKRPVSFLLSNVSQYGDKALRETPVGTLETKDTKKKLKKISLKEFDELLKDTGVLIVPEPARWKWESIRILLKLCSNNSKKLNDTNFKALTKKLIQFYKPSSKKYSHTPIKSDYNAINIYTIVACDLANILLDTNNNDGVKLLSEFLEDLEVQFKQITEAKSVHDCLLSPQRLSNSLSQDYFLLIGRLSNNEVGLSMLKKYNILQRLHYIAVNVNLDCYVKLIVSSLSYVSSEDTRKILSGVLSCNFVSSRLYATKFLHVLLRTSSFKHESFRNWSIEMLVNQLYDENQSISTVALNALNEAADNKEYLDALITLRPSLLHLGDRGLLLLIRFLSMEKGFTYLQAANFVTPQLQRWATSFNTQYTQIVEGELHDAMSQYQKGDDGRYRQRISGSKAVLKDVFIPPHLYGQLVQHAQGFNLLVKQEIIHKMIQVILLADCDSDEAIMELKTALWAMGNFATSSAGAKFLADRGVVKAIVGIAEKCTVHAVKATAFYVLSMVATTKEGVSAINKTTWKCLKRNRQDLYLAKDNHFSMLSLEKLSDDDSETISSPVDFDSPQNDMKNLLEQDEEAGLKFKSMNKFPFEKKSATLPQRGGVIGQIQHNRSLSESKADASDDWSSSGSPPSNIHKYISDIKSNADHITYCSDSFGTDSSTSGISSCDSAYGRPSNYSERVSTLSPIPSTSSLTTVMTNIHPKENRTFLPAKRHSSISFGCRLSAQSALGYKTLRMLQNRHQLGATQSFSASATMEYLSAHDRRQMSPLVRPKFPRYIHEPLVHEFEVKAAAPFQIDENESINISSTIESSQFSHSTEIEEEKSEFGGPCYQGICLPLRLRFLLPSDTDSARNYTSLKKTLHEISKSGDEMESGESDSEQIKLEDHKALSIIQRKRRHEKSTCLLCSTRADVTPEGLSAVRSRKTSTSSMHRIRTETESSYGGGPGLETESPILLTWQQKPVGLMDATPGGASSSTLETSDTQNTSMIENENSIKSRSILRKEVLKLVEQLGNPILYKTCKQGLLQLKQICGDLFQDICLFSDVCSLLGSINYRIQARQLIQDLFLEAPFYELYEEPLNALSRTCPSQDNSETTLDETQFPDAPIRNGDSKSSNSVHKDSAKSDVALDERKSSTNNTLEVIVETDAVSETAKSDRGSVLECNDACSVVEERLCGGDACSVSLGNGEGVLPKQCSPARDQIAYTYDDRVKSLYDCRRAYSYPAASFVVTESGLVDTIHSFETNNVHMSDYCAVAVPTARSRSVSACSYISEVSLKSYLFRKSDDTAKVLGSSSITSSLWLDKLSKSATAAYSRRSLISVNDRSSSVVLRLENPYDLLDIDLRPRIVFKNRQSAEYEYDRSTKNSSTENNESDILVTNVTEAIQRHRKIATFESPDRSLLLKHNPDI